MTAHFHLSREDYKIMTDKILYVIYIKRLDDTPEPYDVFPTKERAEQAKKLLELQYYEEKEVTFYIRTILGNIE